MAPNPEKVITTSSGGYKDRFWIARVWNGMTLGAFFRVMLRNRFHVGPWRIGMALLIATFSGPINTFWAFVQRIFYGRAIARTRIQDHPIFVVGHWRSGTTLLHELLALDPRHTFPETYACFAPSHFLASRRYLPPLLGFCFPQQRPQDNMAMGWDRPQEDEFALCNLGVPSPYYSWAFPNRPPQADQYLTFEGVSPGALSRWKDTFLWFLKCVTLQRPKRIVLKSPTHTGRIRVLLELFPDARFVHIVRDPYVLFPSTMNLWRRLSKDQGFQTPRYEGLEDQVFDRLARMYEAFERDRALIPPRRLAEVRYEDLIADPVGQMRRIYEELDLGGFEDVLPALQQYVASQAGYKPNRYQISPEIRSEIARRWASYIAKYGYGRPEATQDAA